MEVRKPRPEVRARRRGGFGLVAVLPAGARPDEGVAVAVLVVEEIGVDRRVERRIVQLVGVDGPTASRARLGCCQPSKTGAVHDRV